MKKDTFKLKKEKTHCSCKFSVSQHKINPGKSDYSNLHPPNNPKLSTLTTWNTPKFWVNLNQKKHQLQPTKKVNNISQLNHKKTTKNAWGTIWEWTNSFELMWKSSNKPCLRSTNWGFEWLLAMEGDEIVMMDSQKRQDDLHKRFQPGQVFRFVEGHET